MGRIRTVKPELFKHEELYELELSFKLPIRISFVGLFTCCDREGRFKWRPRSLKLDIIPYDDCDFSRVLDALMTRGLVVKYSVNDEEYGYIPTFTKHQVINNRESDSILPDPASGLAFDASITRESRDSHAPSGEGKGREGKGKEKEGKEYATRLSNDWEPTLQDIEFCQSTRTDLNPHEIAQGFKDYWIAQPNAKGKKLDWSATWRNWVRNARQPAQQRPQAQYQSATDKAKTLADRLTGRAKNERIIDIN